jgi:hypothetical protein
MEGRTFNTSALAGRYYRHSSFSNPERPAVSLRYRPVPGVSMSEPSYRPDRRASMTEPDL